MRTTSTGQLAALAAQDRRVDFRVWVANAADTLVEFTDEVLSWSISSSIEQAAATAQIVLQRETSSGSNAPMMATGSAAIEVNRRVRIDAQVVSAGAALGSWVTLFEGVADEPSWGGDASELVLTCRDDWYELQDSWIEATGTYGSTGGTAIATVLQSLITATLGTGGPSIRTVGSPTTVVYEYGQQRMALGDALRRVTDINGWDLRYLWSTGDADFRLTFQQPPRSKTTPDHTFTTSDYFEITDIRRGSSGIRNVCLVEYSTGSTVEASSTGSIAEHGRRFMYVDARQDPQITTTGTAGTIAGIIVDDLSQPLASKSVLARFFWPVELGDLYRFPANSVHYNTAQDMAVVAYQHSYVAGQAPTTTFELRGQPSGGSLRWISKATRTRINQDIVTGPQAIPTSTSVPEITVAPKFTATGALTATVQGDSSIGSVRVLGALNTPPAATSVAAATPIAGASLATSAVGTLATGGAGGDLGYVAAYGYSSTGGAGTPTVFTVTSIPYGTPSGGIPDGAVIATKMSKQAQGFASSVVFSSSSYNNLSWGTGTLEFADGTTQAIAAGSQTLTLTAPTTYYVYYNGTGTLQVTSTYSTAVGDSNVILCVAQRAASSSEGECFYVPALGALRGGIRVTANQIVANSISAAKIDVAQLSAISADVGTLTAGLIQNTASTTFIDLDATGSATFIKAGTDLVVTANGSATFGGEVTADHFSASQADFEGNVYTYGGIYLVAGTYPTSSPRGSITYNTNGPVISNGDSHAILTAGSSDGVSLGYSTGSAVGFYGSAGNAKQTIVGSRSGVSALGNLLTALENLGLITDSST